MSSSVTSSSSPDDPLCPKPTVAALETSPERFKKSISSGGLLALGGVDPRGGVVDPGGGGCGGVAEDGGRGGLAGAGRLGLEFFILSSPEDTSSESN